MGKKILLVTPPYHCGVVESAGRWANLGFLYIAGELRNAGHEVEIYDAMAKDHTYEDIRRRITESRPDIVGSTDRATRRRRLHNNLFLSTMHRVLLAYMWLIYDAKHDAVPEGKNNKL